MLNGNYTPRHLKRYYFVDKMVDQLHISDRVMQHILLKQPTRIIPHPRTIRKAREQVKAMVNDGISTQKISRYLHRFVLWWVKASQIWTYEELVDAFIQSCFEPLIAKPAYSLLPGMMQARSLDLIDCPIAA